MEPERLPVVYIEDNQNMATPEAEMDKMSLDEQRKAAKEAKKKAKEEKAKQKSEKSKQGT